MDPENEWVEVAVEGEQPVDVVAITREALRSRGLPGERGAYVRRILLGPPARFGAAPPEAGKSSAHEHPYCPCCLTTNCFEAFRPLIEADETFALRLFAARRDDGEPLADCRVNGQDY